MLKIETFIFSPIQENTYLLYNEARDCIIIDPGCYYDEEKAELVGFIKNNDLVPKMLLNTHCHLDHVFGNRVIANAFNLTLHIHPEEESMLQMAPASGLMFELPFDNYDGKFIFLNDGDKIHLGDDELTVILAPGHSPGSICFYSEKQHFVISGDCLFNGSIGRTDLPRGNYQTLIKSIKEKLFALPDDVIVYSGHGPVTTIGEEKRSNPFVGVSASVFIE